ncbi:S-adenosyl-L-methionine-dependent methyltransferase [Podospora appendiculata]|uniref:S-adenosyl-L-methionine-dependent methyltransferase n=1 Tax=Podospora appendiculata TaxID=314037 RepID=A0AAE0X6M2_9PEZI|nr:S-adenosyl-L-methionine-dependent methyltransferase [Podospora appendiculata]
MDGTVSQTENPALLDLVAGERDEVDAVGPRVGGVARAAPAAVEEPGLRSGHEDRDEAVSLTSVALQRPFAFLRQSIMGTSTTTPAVRYLDTASAYDLWSAVYDTDNNFLQALDTREMQSLLPKLFSALADSTLPPPWKLVDLGCGTGRNTMHLLSIPDVDEIVALDLSPKMLDVARQRISSGESTKVTLQVYDLMASSNPTPPPRDSADAIISTLVLEHVPLNAYFAAAKGMLKPRGLLLLTNMHPAMGQISQAGFLDPVTGEKIKAGRSYAHTVGEVVEEARAWGFEVAVGFEERAVTEENWAGFGDRARKWVGVDVWFGGVLRLRGEREDE